MKTEGADDQPTAAVPNQVSHVTHRSDGESVRPAKVHERATENRFGKGLRFWPFGLIGRIVRQFIILSLLN